MADILDRRPGGGGAGGSYTTYRDQGNQSYAIDTAALLYGWDGSVWQKGLVDGSGNLKVNIAAGGGTGGGPADVATSIAASEADTGRQKVTAALRAWDTSKAAGSQLVALPGDQTNGLWVNVKQQPAGGATTSITNSFIVVNQGTSPWQTSISGTVTVAGTATVTQGGTTPWQTNTTSIGSSGAALTSTGNSGPGTQRVVLASDQPTVSTSIAGTVTVASHAVTQGTSPWIINGGSVSISGTVATSQQGTVTVVQGTSPWIIQGGSVSISGTVATSQQGTISLGAGTSALGDVNLAPAARGGYSVASFTALTTVTSVSGSAAGKFGGYNFINLNSAPAYIQVFDSGSTPSLGSTVPTFVIPIPANATPANGAASVQEYANGIAIANKIWVAAATTATGGATVATALIGHVQWK